MLTRTHGRVQFECDGCTDILDTETREFEEARAILKREGWTSKAIKSEWGHYCPKCQGD